MTTALAVEPQAPEDLAGLLFAVLRLLSEDVNSCYECMREIALAR